MARKKLLHLKSGVVNSNGTPKLPTSEQIELGEIAVNYAKGHETLAIKNSSGDVVSFSNDNILMDYIDEHAQIEPVQTTGSSTTDVMSQSAVTTELAQKLAVSDFNTYSGTVDTLIGGKASQSDLSALNDVVTAHTANTTAHVTSSDKTKWNSVDDKLNTSDFNTYSGNVDTAINGKVDKIEGKGLSTEDYTTAEKNKLSGIAEGAEVNVQADWSETATTSDSYILNKPTIGTAAAKGVSAGITNSDNLIESRHIYSGVGVTIAYDSTSKYIQLKSTSGNVLSSFDATAFIKDGMVSNVEINGGNLVITFNADSGKEAISIPLTSIFNPSNYYTTGQTSGSTQIQTALDGKSDTSHTHDDRYYTEIELTGSSTTVVVAKANSATTAANASTVNGHTVNADVPSDAVFTDNNTTYEAGSFITITGTNNTISVSTGTSSTTVARGNHTHSNYLTGITSSDVTTALGYTPTNVHYSKVSVTGNLTNVVCPTTLSTDGEQCNVLYVNNSTQHTVSISTNYKSPDNSQITLTIKANGYAEVNYLYFGGTTYVRAV